MERMNESAGERALESVRAYINEVANPLSMQTVHRQCRYYTRR